MIADARAVDRARIATRLGWGLMLLVAPAPVLRASTSPVTPAWCAVARLLGVRHVAQALVELRVAPRRPALLRAVDGAHAASALVVARLDRGRRRLALIDAAIATGFALT